VIDAEYQSSQDRSDPSCTVTASARLSQNLPVTPEDQDLIDRAVNASGLTRTDFVLQPARLAAQELLIEQTWPSVGAEAFERFAAALEGPAHANERLRSPAPAQSDPGQFPDPTAQLLLLNVFQQYGPPLGNAVLIRQTAGTALGNSK